MLIQLYISSLVELAQIRIGREPVRSFWTRREIIGIVVKYFRATRYGR